MLRRDATAKQDEPLGEVENLEYGRVVLSVNLPADELSWLVDHPKAAWIAEDLRLGKRPFLWCYRPSVWPAWNAQHRRVVRFWSVGAGLDGHVVEALAEKRFNELAIVEPTRAGFVEQLQLEMVTSRQHLQAVLDGYWDQTWRRQHKWGEGPEDHLWRAAEGLREIEEALSEST